MLQQSSNVRENMLFFAGLFQMHLFYFIAHKTTALNVNKIHYSDGVNRGWLYALAGS